MMKKKILPIFVTAAMVFTGTFANVGVASANADKFTDINGHWGESVINEAAGLGVVGGYPEGYYLPDNLMKREEFYKLITNVLTVVPDTTNTVVSFKDVDPIEWYVPTVKIAVAAGITSGYEDGTFGIGQMISRQEAAKVVATVISANNLDTSKNASASKDASLIGDWALPHVNVMFQKGYMKGDTDGNFRPTTALTRAEAATLLLNVKKSETVIAGPGKTGATTTTPVVTTPTGTAGCQKEHSVTEGAFTVGTGTAKDPYRIQTEAQLNHMREHLADGSCFILANDIKIKSDFATVVPSKATSETNWSEGNFVPIGTKESPFKGSFDGNGHSISGLMILGNYGAKSEETGYVGLFGYIGSSGSVEGLTIGDSTLKGAVYVGGVAGYNDGKITNCVLGTGSKVTGMTNTGGITGYTTKTLNSNVNRGNVVGSTNTGGIVGSANLEGHVVKDCVNRGSVSGKSKTGGIIGYIGASSMTITIDSCSNVGEVSSTANYAGGIVGHADGSSFGVYIIDCYNTGTLSGEGVNGGIVGYAMGRKTKINNCYNTGEITGVGAGGIAGSNEGDIQGCYNTGKIVANTEAGGIVGYQNTGEGRLIKCYNDGAITGNNNVGGLAGLSKDSIYNCYNTGKIKGSSDVGGLVGSNYADIQMSYNAGMVTCDNNGGSLTGRNRGGLMNCFWLTGTSDTDIGIEDSSSSRKIVKKVSKEELSGQVKIKFDNGYQLITGYLNEKAGVRTWTFLYRVTQAANESSTTVISDGGGVVKNIELASTDPAGNTIDAADINSVYLYPSLIEVKRK